MTKEEIVEQSNKILASVNSNYYGAKAQTEEFFKNYGGNNNSFVTAVQKIPHSTNSSYMKIQLEGIIRSFIEYVENGLLRNLSLEREIQIETVSDYLSQAESLLNDKSVHPVAPAVIIGASLEEFLRNWLEDANTDMSQMKPSLDAYTQALRKQNLVNKQDVKDITSWSGTRNDAAHGQWESVSDRNRIRLMLEGVNLFMRKYS